MCSVKIKTVQFPTGLWKTEGRDLNVLGPFLLKYQALKPVQYIVIVMRYFT